MVARPRKAKRGWLGLPILVAAALGACGTTTAAVGRNSTIVLASASTISKLVKRANEAQETTFHATFSMTTQCGNHECRITDEVWQRSRTDFVWRTSGERGEIVFGDHGAFTCRPLVGSRQLGCIRVSGMGPSMLASNYPPVLAEGDLTGLATLGTSGPVHLQTRAVNGRVARCLLFGALPHPSATACVDTTGLVVYLHTSNGPNDGFDGTIELTSFARSVPSSIFKLPAPVSKDG